MAANQPHVTFTNGFKMPSVGFGTWQSSPEDVKRAVQCALESGYRHIDTAFAYFNEAAIGEVLTDWLQSGKVKREELFIVTKLPPFGNKPEKVDWYLKESLKGLNLDYVDLYLIHFPAGLKEGEAPGTVARNANNETIPEPGTDLEALWKAMELQVDQGRAKSIGISNFNSQQIERVVKASRIMPANLQVEMHAYFQQKPLRAVCAKHGITVCAYAPLGSAGRFQATDAQGKPRNPVASLLENPVVLKIASAHSKSAAQVLLRHLIQLDVVVIPKSVTPKRVVENFQVFDFSLSNKEMEALNALDMGQEGRSFYFEFFPGINEHAEFPLHIPF